MWALLAKKTQFSILAGAVVILLFVYIMQGGNVPRATDLQSLPAYSNIFKFLASYFAALYFAARWFGIFAWRLPLLGAWLGKNVGPDLRGTWRSSVKYLSDDGQELEKNIKLFIKMSLFHFEMKMEADDQYSFSNVVCSRMLKDEVLDSFVLYYVYESEVKNPLPTDVGVFQGGAKLRLVGPDNLQGTYWTNRNYQNRRQTAGALTMVRVR